MKNLIIILFIISQCNFLTAQVASINTMEICAGQEVLVHVNGSTLNNIGALTLYIGFDTINLTFLSIENIDPQLYGMSANMMTNPTQLAFAWSNTVPISFNEGIMFDIKFSSTDQSSTIFFNTGCELTDTGGVVIPVLYVNGAINSGLPVIISNPVDTTVFINGNAKFYVNSPNSTSYLWNESQDNGVSWIALDDNEIYSGSHSGLLSISHVPLKFNNYLYKCILYHGLCQINSNAARLMVDELSSAYTESVSNKESFCVSPVPFCDFLNLEFFKQSISEIQIVNIEGQLVENIELPSYEEGYHYIKLNTVNWLSGFYVIKVKQLFPDHIFNSVIKVIRK